MPGSRAVLVVDALIVITLLAAAGVAATVILTATQSIPTLTIGTLTASTAGGVTNIDVPFTLTDRGPLTISDLTIQLVVADEANETVVPGHFGPISIAPGQVRKGVVILPLNLSTIPHSVLQNLVEKSQDLTVRAYVSTSLQPFFALSGNVSEVVTWGALVSNLHIGTPSVSLLNSSAMSLSLPVQFQNENPYVELSGTARIQVLDSKGVVRGGGTLNVEAPPGQAFSSDANLVVEIPSEALQSLVFNDTELTYEAVASLAVGGGAYSATVPFTVAWGAPVGGLAIGDLSTTAYNSTCSRFSIPIGFSDRSSFLTLSGGVSAVLLNSTGSQVGAASPVILSVKPGQSFARALTGVVRTSYLAQGELLLKLSFETPLGTGTWQKVVGVG